jgi:hypothetical protein
MRCEISEASSGSCHLWSRKYGAQVSTNKQLWHDLNKLFKNIKRQKRNWVLFENGDVMTKLTKQNFEVFLVESQF